MKKVFKNPILKMVVKILSGTIFAVVLVVAAFLIYYVITAKIYEAKGSKYEPMFSMYTIISPSMVPNINVYDTVFDIKADINDIQEGDIITFISTSSLSEGTTITHRVVNVIETEQGRKFRTKGDNNLTADSSLVDQEHLIGKVLFKIPQLGRLQFLLQSKGGWLFALLIPAIGVVIYDIIKVIRLSNVKTKVEETLKEPEKDEEEIKKQQALKKKLKKKFVGVEEVEPIMHTVEPDPDEVVEKPKKNKKEKVKKEKVKEEKVKEVEEIKDEVKEEAEKYDIDMSKVFENIKKLDEEESNENKDNNI